LLLNNPNHPGLLHYLIHAYEQPQLAEGALEAANKYGKYHFHYAHPLHMPR
jgi:hypothetical protein